MRVPPHRLGAVSYLPWGLLHVAGGAAIVIADAPARIAMLGAGRAGQPARTMAGRGRRRHGQPASCSLPARRSRCIAANDANGIARTPMTMSLDKEARVLLTSY